MQYLKRSNMTHYLLDNTLTVSDKFSIVRCWDSISKSLLPESLDESTDGSSKKGFPSPVINHFKFTSLIFNAIAFNISNDGLLCLSPTIVFKVGCFTSATLQNRLILPLYSLSMTNFIREFTVFIYKIINRLNNANALNY